MGAYSALRVRLRSAGALLGLGLPYHRFARGVTELGGLGFGGYSGRGC